jgi:hypothetical protein
VAWRADQGRVEGNVRTWLRAEGAATLIAGIWLYAAFKGQWLWLIPLLLVPDISMLGYLARPAVGAMVYNVAHNLAVALALVAVGIVLGIVPLQLGGAILIAHIGGDRALGYGLKYPTAFGDTHLGRIGRR